MHSQVIPNVIRGCGCAVNLRIPTFRLLTLREELDIREIFRYEKCVKCKFAETCASEELAPSRIKTG